MKVPVFWDKTRRNPSEMAKFSGKVEVFTAMTMMNAFFLDVTPCGSCKNRCFGGA
jgi:hypothetical protein